MKFNLRLKRSDSQRDAELFANLAATLDFFFGHHFFDNGHYHIRHMLFCKHCEFFQRVEGLDSESRAREVQKFFGVRGVHRDGNGVETAFEIGRYVSIVDQVCKSVRIEAYF